MDTFAQAPAPQSPTHAGGNGSRSLYWLTLVVALTAAAGLTACDPPSGDRDLGRVGDSVALASSDGENSSLRLQRELAALGASAHPVADAAISATVHSQLALDGELRHAGIGVDTFQGRVALRGTAPNAPARERASQIAASIDGVRSIDNRLQVPTA